MVVGQGEFGEDNEDEILDLQEEPGGEGRTNCGGSMTEALTI